MDSLGNGVICCSYSGRWLIDLATSGNARLSFYSYLLYCDHSLHLACWSALGPAGRGRGTENNRQTDRY
jgi:hypothetical protein